MALGNNDAPRNPASWYERQQIELDEARKRAAETAAKLKTAPQAAYPTPQQPNLPGATAPRAQQPASAPAKPGAAPAKPEPAQAKSSTPGIDAVLAVTRRSAARAEGYAADARAQAEDSAKRKARLRGELRMKAFQMANPNASPLELDMARRGRG